MEFLQKIKNRIKQYIIKRAGEHKAVDIIEVRTKQIGLLSVQTETDLLIKNSFFLSYTLLSIKTDLLNKDGIKVGKMTFDVPTKVKGNSELVFTTSSEISIITSLFQALSNLLSQPIWMRSVGIATVKVLWFTVELPVDDVFEIHPSKLKIVKDETEEERTIRLQKEAAWKEKYEAEKEKRKAERTERRAEWKEDILKRRYKENYISKEERLRQAQSNLRQAQSGVQQIQSDNLQTQSDDIELIITNEQNIPANMEIVLDSNINEISKEEILENKAEENLIENKNAETQE